MGSREADVMHGHRGSDHSDASSAVATCDASANDGSHVRSSIKMLINELAGKHNAAQVYDERIWTVRTGVLTLTFASWGALLAVGNDLAGIKEGGAPMLAITLALMIGGLAVEVFYVRRKYRCMSVINSMGPEIFRLLESAPGSSPELQKIESYLRFSGDDNEVKPESTNGFFAAIIETSIIYGIPAAGFFVVYRVLAHLSR